jgi:internalin A
MNVTKDFLKKESANFDVECIFQLNLQNKGIISKKRKYLLVFPTLDWYFLDITNLGSLSECSNLEILNLSFNDINNLSSLKTLINLQYLNLSCNRISNLGKNVVLSNLTAVFIF